MRQVLVDSNKSLTLITESTGMCQKVDFSKAVFHGVSVSVPNSCLYMRQKIIVKYLVNGYCFCIGSGRRISLYKNIVFKFARLIANCHM